VLDEVIMSSYRDVKRKVENREERRSWMTWTAEERERARGEREERDRESMRFFVKPTCQSLLILSSYPLMLNHC
jgi:hypothetical protein